MLLAAILSLSIFCSGPAMDPARGRIQSGQQPAEGKPDSSPPSGQSNTGDNQPQPSVAPKVNPPSDSSTAAPKPPAAPKRKRQGTKNTAPCNASADRKTPGGATDSGAGSSAAASNTPAPTAHPCGPAKVVVRNGGTGEAAIELTGGSAAPKDSPQRTETARLLGSTEEALKKIGGEQLDGGQQETVKQVHQYAAQSKAALDAGDLELAHNLATKAHLLVDQLMKRHP